VMKIIVNRRNYGREDIDTWGAIAGERAGAGYNINANRDTIPYHHTHTRSILQ
jgi:hypothetical protein